MFTDINKTNGKIEINQAFMEKLSQIIRQYGEGIFEKDHLYAYMTDYFPGEKEFLALVKALQEDGVYSKLLTFRNNCGNDPQRMKNVMETEKIRLQSKFFWNEEIARFCIDIFKVTEEAGKLEKQSSQYEKRENKAEELIEESEVFSEEDNLWQSDDLTESGEQVEENRVEEGHIAPVFHNNKYRSDNRTKKSRDSRVEKILKSIKVHSAEKRGYFIG